MKSNIYQIAHPDELITPVLLYFKDYIIENIKKAVAIAGEAQRLWPHVKTHKTRELICLLIEQGVTRFKCATIAEAEVVASCGPTDIILAYPLVGPNVSRFLSLQRDFPKVRFWSIGDDLDQLRHVGAAAVASGAKIHFLADVNVGQNRTGVAFDKLISFYEAVAATEGLEPDGFHCYDGHIHQSDYDVRTQLAAEIMEKVTALKERLVADGYSCSHLVMGGTPTFPCYAKYPDVYLAPGTVFLSDYGYSTSYRDMDFTPAGVIMTRVISRPTPDTFTLDLGYKGIAADPNGVRGVIVGMEDIAAPLAQSEEHWVFQIAPGHEDEIPPVGSELYVMPSHICPSTALYPFVPVVEQGKIAGHWDIAARNRKLTY
ncbi:D-TA family PLP-dependent enzyme [Oscillibacter sp.]|uniref:D-TA family PLP-dependent enzyme n=1 Tax=Oscillibacter sp. TaxID=1945593 RepID=UPI0026151CFE|nr:D-TA family PLP-dependent enzyme [Oscillibacter sp.]MDD3347657.1 D-TA family PLP-dependent enzyme [Oscillibacter sp.]